MDADKLAAALAKSAGIVTTVTSVNRTAKFIKILSVLTAVIIVGVNIFASVKK